MVLTKSRDACRVKTISLSTDSSAGQTSIHLRPKAKITSSSLITNTLINFLTPFNYHDFCLKIKKTQKITSDDLLMHWSRKYKQSILFCSNTTSAFTYISCYSEQLHTLRFSKQISIMNAWWQRQIQRDSFFPASPPLSLMWEALWKLPQSAPA